jgi:hypothetical protein
MFLSDNLFDRPVENLLVYLELLLMNVNLFDATFYSIKIRNDQMKNRHIKLIDIYENIIFNKQIIYKLNAFF